MLTRRNFLESSGLLAAWGFLSHRGTNSNMHGAHIGRTLLKERTGALPKIYYTAEAHYSSQINRDLLSLSLA